MGTTPAPHEHDTASSPWQGLPRQGRQAVEERHVSIFWTRLRLAGRHIGVVATTTRPGQIYFPSPAKRGMLPEE